MTDRREVVVNPSNVDEDARRIREAEDGDIIQHGDSTVFVRDGETVGGVLGPQAVTVNGVEIVWDPFKEGELQ